MRKILAVLSNGKPYSHREIVKATGLSDEAVWGCLRRCWHKRLILRSDKPLHEFNRKLKGRAGIRTNMRSYHRYLMNTASVKGFKIVGNTTFVEYEESKNGSAGSKAKLILEFIKSHGDQAYFSKEIVEALKESGIRATDVKSNVRRFERRGLIFVRGYRVNERQTSVSERLPVNMA